MGREPVVPAAGAEVDSGSVYCFSAEDFAGAEEIAGICITELPQDTAGTLALGSRILRPGDILTAEQVGSMTFTPVPGEEDRELQVGYPASAFCLQKIFHGILSMNSRQRSI